MSFSNWLITVLFNNQYQKEKAPFSAVLCEKQEL